VYELGKKQKEIAEQRNKIYKLYGIISFFVLSSIIIVLLIRNRNQKNKQKMQQQFATQLLATQEAERQRIAKELHDSVGQNILFIKNQIQKIFSNTNPTLTQSVDNALQEVRAISKDLYPNQLDQYGLIAAVETLCEQVKLGTDLFISSELQIEDYKLSKEIKINCYRIIQESLSNIIKHAKASAVRITATMENGWLQLIIQDNGIGFDNTNKMRSAQHSFGLLNLEERVHLLNGKFAIESDAGKGTKLLFAMPI
jgi:signal transduction histidine kinase